jgi:hypothetical protein
MKISIIILKILYIFKFLILIKDYKKMYFTYNENEYNVASERWNNYYYNIEKY